MKILFHICCGNCALYPVKLLRSEGHDFAGYWYNPNIHPLEEYQSRLDSVKDLSDKWRIEMLYSDEYNPDEFFGMFSAQQIPPSPERCKYCYQLRLEKTAAKAREEGFEAFSTTLLISPYQDFEQIINAGRKLADAYDVMFFEKDFRSFFRKAMSLSKELGLYRQKYCGCLFSKQEREQAIKAKEMLRGSQNK
ncbi:MAG: hypothetical protein C4538_06250 [Nitrospiraceae bacterium]|nr:MAG: hypothetical protein C4538_06250 [Nitrospiraceae bacterium]